MMYSLSIVERLAVFLATSCVLFVSLIQGILLGIGKTSTFAAIDAWPRLLQALLVTLLWTATLLNFSNALVAFAASFFIFMPWIFLNIISSVGIESPRLRQFVRMIRSGFIYAVSLFLISLQGRIGLFFLTGDGMDQQSGQFFAAQRVTELFLDIATAAAVVLFSETARAEDTRASFAAATRTATMLLLAFVVIGIAMAVFAPLLVTVALGDAYRDAKVPLVILAIGLGPAAASRIMNSVVLGVGKPWLSAIIAAIGVLTNIIICFLTTRYYGANGASFALVIGQSISLLCYAVVAKVMFDMQFVDMMPKFGVIILRIKNSFTTKK